MLAHIKLNKPTLIRWKVYIDRARMYIGYIQFFMIGVVFMEAFRDEPFGQLIFQYIYISIPILFVLFIVGSIIIGYLDSRFGLREEELRNLSSSNPVLRDIQRELSEIKQTVQHLETKNPSET
ncbi:hypothetical protein [Tunicatimonas pelagia]|uniref:hypothetical protein n=1 Tax=Tunicatimonas pelagia TaxID=931531 RepID=UPI0026653246|nr:hypothetical protein [Tunicatimonas pelagia]WKN41550.1 hypothetical protein P0M28_21170 [Tunicatimonas pelagia]